MESPKEDNVSLSSLSNNSCVLSYTTAYNIQTFLATCTSILELNLKQNKFGDDGIEVIAQALVGKASNLENVNLSQTQMTKRGFFHVMTALRSNHTLQKLVADYNNLCS